MTGTGSKQLFRRAGAVVFWLAVLCVEYMIR